MAHHKKGLFRIYLEYIPFAAFYHIVRLIPLKTAYAINRNLFKLFYWLDAKHRNRTIQHIRHSGICNTEEEVKALSKKTFAEFSKLLVEIIQFDLHYTKDKIRVGGTPAALKYCMEEHHNIIVATAHYGNWEVAGTAWAEASGIPISSIMRPFDNPKIGELILKHRRSKVHELIDKKGGIKDVLKALKNKRHVAILMDQHVGKSGGGITVNFFGHPAGTHTSPALLYLKTGTVIVPEVTRRLSDDFEFEVRFGEPIFYEPTGDKEKDIFNITQQATTGLELLIREQPEQWLWAHRRWLDINR